MKRIISSSVLGAVALLLVGCGGSATITAKEMRARAKAWKQPKPRYTHGVLAKYAKLVNSAHLGAVTDADL